MNENFLNWNQVSRVLRLAVPHMLLVLFILLSFVTMPFDLVMRPYLVLMLVYYWAIYRPTLMPPWLCFLIGLLLDIMSGGPLGFSALVLVLVRWIVSDQRRFLMGQPYITTWVVFGVLAAVIAVFEWGAFGLVSMEWMSMLNPLFSFLLSLSFFPFVTLLLVRIHKILPQFSGTMPGSAMR